MLTAIFLTLLALVLTAYLLLYGLLVVWKEDNEYMCVQQICLATCFILLSIVLVLTQGYLIRRLT